MFSYHLVQREAVVDTRRQRDQVPFSHGDPDPPVLLVPDVKVGLAVQDVAYLVVQVEVLLEEHLQLQEKQETSHSLQIELTFQFQHRRRPSDPGIFNTRIKSGASLRYTWCSDGGRRSPQPASISAQLDSEVLQTQTPLHAIMRCHSEV